MGLVPHCRAYESHVRNNTTHTFPKLLLLIACGDKVFGKRTVPLAYLSSTILPLLSHLFHDPVLRRIGISSPKVDSWHSSVPCCFHCCSIACKISEAFI